MKKLTNSFSIIIIFISTLFLTCKKEKDTSNIDQEVSFGISIPNFQKSLPIKSAKAYNLNNARKIVLTIQNADGSSTIYSSTKVKIYQMNGAFFSQKLILKSGSYKLTEFLLLDSMDNTIFATPLTGSDEAPNVTHPLPISFDIDKNISTLVNVEVVSTENKRPEDFGLVRFIISEIARPEITFIIGVADKESGQLLKTKITVSCEYIGPDEYQLYPIHKMYVHNQMLDAISNNQVTVKDTLDEEYYTLIVEKEGYIPYFHLFSKSSLKLINDEESNSPLLIELEKLKDLNTVADVDGNIYKTVKVGNQVWMAENLKVTHLNNGLVILQTPNDEYWNEMSLFACYRWYNDDENYKNTHGALYNSTSIRTSNLCPTGWHIPCDEEWAELIANLGGASVAGGKLKEIGTTHWLSPNWGATNETGFTALPGGYYKWPERFTGIGEFGQWGSSSENGHSWRLDYSKESFDMIDAGEAQSIRCVKD